MLLSDSGFQSHRRTVINRYTIQRIWNTPSVLDICFDAGKKLSNVTKHRLSEGIWSSSTSWGPASCDLLTARGQPSAHDPAACFVSPPPETGERDTLAREWVEKLSWYGRTFIFQKSLKRIKINIKAEIAGSYSSVKEADWTKFCAEKLYSVFLLTFSEKWAFWYIQPTTGYDKFGKWSFTVILILLL